VGVATQQQIVFFFFLSFPTFAFFPPPWRWVVGWDGMVVFFSGRALLRRWWTLFRFKRVYRAPFDATYPPVFFEPFLYLGLSPLPLTIFQAPLGYGPGSSRPTCSLEISTGGTSLILASPLRPFPSFPILAALSLWASRCWTFQQLLSPLGEPRPFLFRFVIFVFPLSRGLPPNQPQVNPVIFPPSV